MNLKYIILLTLLPSIFFSNLYADSVYEDTKINLDENNNIAYVGGGSLSLRLTKFKFSNMLFVIDFSNGKIDTLNGQWDTSDSVRKVKLSSDNMNIAIIHQNKNRKNMLSVYSKTKKEVILNRGENVLALNWCDNNSKMIYINAKNNSNNLGDVHVYDFLSKKDYIVANNAEKIFCSGNKIYIKKYNKPDRKYSQVYSYDFFDKKMLPLEIKDVNISPNSDYYCQIVTESETMAHPVIRNIKTKKIVRKLNDEALPSRGIVNCRWIEKNKILLHSLSTYFVYDVKENKIIGKTNVNAKKFPISFSSNKVVTHENGYWVLKDLLTGKEYKRFQDKYFN